MSAQPPRHTDAELEAEREVAVARFRKERLEESVEQYGDFFDEYLGEVERLLETTVDLTRLHEHVLAVLGDKKLFESYRYLVGPPVSTADLMTIAEARTLAPKKLRRDPETLDRIFAVVRDSIDRRRFAWVVDGREPTETERAAAVVASAALMATQRQQTSRRNAARVDQEGVVAEVLAAAGLRRVAARTVDTFRDAPGPGEFCRESSLAGLRADFLIGLHDGRVVALECKVSNSATNSVKRLNREAAGKATAWLASLGSAHVVPGAVLSGVYKLHNLVDAQQRGLTLFWAHRLEALTEWIARTT